MVNISKTKLKNLAEFTQVLANYRPSDENIELLKSLHPVFLVGPTAAGRNTLINLLTATGRYHQIVSDTTRPKRTNNGIPEENGREYWFKSESEFLDDLKNGVYLEAAVIHGQQVSGMSMAELQKARLMGLTPINEIEQLGADNISGFTNNALFVFLMPPSFDVWMQRLRDRGDMDEDEVIRRLNSSLLEIGAALSKPYYHFVINTEIHEAAVAVDELAFGREPNKDKQQKGRDHAEQLAIDVQLYLSNN